MPTSEISDENVHRPSLIRVDWFNREPVGGTLCLRSAGDDEAARVVATADTPGSSDS